MGLNKIKTFSIINYPRTAGAGPPKPPTKKLAIASEQPERPSLGEYGSKFDLENLGARLREEQGKLNQLFEDLYQKQLNVVEDQVKNTQGLSSFDFSQNVKPVVLEVKMEQTKQTLKGIKPAEISGDRLFNISYQGDNMVLTPASISSVMANQGLEIGSLGLTLLLILSVNWICFPIIKTAQDEVHDALRFQTGIDLNNLD